MKWSCSGFPNGVACENGADFVITIEGNEEGDWNAKTGRCAECLQRQFPNGKGLSYLEAVDVHTFAVPYNATNNVQQALERIIYKTTDYPFHAQV